MLLPQTAQAVITGRSGLNANLIGLWHLYAAVRLSHLLAVCQWHQLVILWRTYTISAMSLSSDSSSFSSSRVGSLRVPGWVGSAFIDLVTRPSCMMIPGKRGPQLGCESLQFLAHCGSGTDSGPVISSFSRRRLERAGLSPLSYRSVSLSCLKARADLHPSISGSVTS